MKLNYSKTEDFISRNLNLCYGKYKHYLGLPLVQSEIMCVLKSKCPSDLKILLSKR